jgi:hypothetical protein
LVSLSQAPAQAQPLGQAKVAIISTSFFSSSLLTQAFLGKLMKTKVIKGTKLGNQKNVSPIRAHVDGLFLIKRGISEQTDKNKSYKGYKVRQPKKLQPNRKVHARARAQKGACAVCF